MQTIRIYNQDKDMEFGTLLKEAMRNNGKNRTSKSRKTQNTLMKEKLQVFGNTGSGHYQTSGD